jgi:hypothetical protein
MGKSITAKAVLLLIFLFFIHNTYSDIVKKTYVVSGEGNSRSEAMRNALYNVLIKCAEEMGGNPVGLEEFIKKFPSPADYVLGYKIISSRYEDKKVILDVMADVDVKSLRDIFAKEGIISIKSPFPVISMEFTAENRCKYINSEEIRNFLGGVSKTEFPDYFREATESADYQIKIQMMGEERKVEEISFCLFTLGIEIKGKNGTLLNKKSEKPVYAFPSEIFPQEVSNFVKEFFVEAIEMIEKDWEVKGNIVKIVIRIAGWLPLKDVEPVRKILVQNFPSLSSFNLLSESSQNIEFMCTFAGPSEGIIEKLISTLNSNGWSARKITEEIIEVKKQ